MGLLANGLVVLSVMIHTCAASSEGTLVSSECLNQRTQLSRALHDAEELERQWLAMKRKVEESRMSVLERQRALSSCELSSTAIYSFSQLLPASNPRNGREILEGGYIAASCDPQAAQRHRPCYGVGTAQLDARGIFASLGGRRSLLQAGMRLRGRQAALVCVPSLRKP